MNYWLKRIETQSEILNNKTSEETIAQLVKYYQDALSKTQVEVERLYDKINKSGEPRIVDLYQYNRYYEFQTKLANRLRNLGAREQKILGNQFKNFYNEVQLIITTDSPSTISNSFVQVGRAEEVLKSIWCADGKNWSDRVWNHQGLLQTSIEKGLIDAVVRGVAKDKVVDDLKHAFNVSMSNADRLVRTELNYVQNQAAIDRYKAAGLEYYEILSSQADDETCGPENGKVYRLDQMQVGVNCPPFHPNCKCTIIPVLEGR